MTPTQLLSQSEKTSNITVEGLLVNISPIKNKRFVGELIDTQHSIPIVGFDPSKQQAISNSDTKEVKLSNCDLKLNKFTKKPEILVQRRTVVSKSNTSIKVDNPHTVGSTSIFLAERSSLSDGDKVNVRIKVINIQDKKKTAKNLTKQEVIIADKTDNAVLTLWEDDMDSLELAESSELNKITVKIFCGEHTFSYPKFGASISQIEDIGEVVEDIVDPTEPCMEGVTIAGVKDLFTFKICLHKIALTPNIHIDDVVTCKECSTPTHLRK